jgi:hypothetical protein
MKTRSIAIAAVALVATSTAFADASPAAKVARPQPAPRAQTVVEELADGMREILRAVTPEIALPTIEIKLPTLDARR